MADAADAPAADVPAAAAVAEAVDQREELARMQELVKNMLTKQKAQDSVIAKMAEQAEIFAAGAYQSVRTKGKDMVCANEKLFGSDEIMAGKALFVGENLGLLHVLYKALTTNDFPVAMDALTKLIRRHEIAGEAIINSLSFEQGRKRYDSCDAYMNMSLKRAEHSVEPNWQPKEILEPEKSIKKQVADFIAASNPAKKRVTDSDEVDRMGKFQRRGSYGNGIGYGRNNGAQFSKGREGGAAKSPGDNEYRGGGGGRSADKEIRGRGGGQR